MKRRTKKLLSTFTTATLLFASLGMQGTHAEGETKLQITSTQTMEIDKNDNTKINYYTDVSMATQVGSVQVRTKDDLSKVWTADLTKNGATYDLTNLTGNEVTVVLSPVKGYVAPKNYSFGDNHDLMFSENTANLTIVGDKINTLNFDFVKDTNTGGNQPGPGGQQGGGNFDVKYKIRAYFDGETNPVIIGQDDYINIPETWTSGKVTFKAETPTGVWADAGIEGIINLDEINHTATTTPSGKMDSKMNPLPATEVNITEGFAEYGKLMLHIVKAEETDLDINQIVTLGHAKLVNITADATLAISQSFGTAPINQAIITKDEPKDVKIFFGNDETQLVVNGQDADKIISVTGGINPSKINDKTWSVELPGLDKETTTPVKVTVEKVSGGTITRTVNIVRTAIQLQHNYGGGDDTVYAGYVVNKGYLYNNQPHNDAVFNAYLQVVLYKDNVVAGYKQIKIDDEALVKGLQNNQSGSLELYSEDQIAVYGKEAGGLIDGVNKVSVFLTNGPIDFTGDTLPSVEFGIGSGVTCEWGALS